MLGKSRSLRKGHEIRLVRVKIVPILKALTFFVAFMALFKFISGLLLHIDKAYGDLLLLCHYLGFPTFFTLLFMKLWDGTNFTDLGFKDSEEAPKRFVIGALIGFCVISSFFLSFYCLGYVKFLGRVEPPGASTLLQDIVLYLILVYNEELIFRGYILNTARESGSWPSLIISSITFGAAHLSNPNINPLALLGLIVAGFLLGVSFLVFDEIWLPIGMHFMWNLAEEKIFGMPLSGLKPKSWLFAVEIVGPDLITGGNFGPEGGVLPILMEILLIMAILKFRLRVSQ